LVTVLKRTPFFFFPVTVRVKLIQVHLIGNNHGI
jgi:hypothetical protein